MANSAKSLVSNDDPSRDSTVPNSEAASELDTSSDLVWRLISLIGERQIASVAREWGLKDATLRQYLKGSMPSLEKAAQIALAEKVSVHWLATGTGPRDIPPLNELPQVGTEREQAGGMLVQDMELHPIDLDMVSLPRLSVEASAGSGLVPVDEEIDGFIAMKREYLRSIDVSPKHAHIAILNGHSMKPTLLDRDLIVIDTSKTEVLNEHIYALVYGDAVLAKRIQLLWDGSLRLMSDNKTDGYSDEIVSAADRQNLRIIGRIKGYLRTF